MIYPVFLLILHAIAKWCRPHIINVKRRKIQCLIFHKNHLVHHAFWVVMTPISSLIFQHISISSRNPLNVIIFNSIIRFLRFINVFVLDKFCWNFTQLMLLRIFWYLINCFPNGCHNLFPECSSLVRISILEHYGCNFWFAQIESEVFTFQNMRTLEPISVRNLTSTINLDWFKYLYFMVKWSEIFQCQFLSCLVFIFNLLVIVQHVINLLKLLIIIIGIIILNNFFLFGWLHIKCSRIIIQCNQKVWIFFTHLNTQTLIRLAFIITKDQSHILICQRWKWLFRRRKIDHIQKVGPFPGQANALHLIAFGFKV